MAIRRASKFRFLAACGVAGVMAFSACAINEKAAPTGSSREIAQSDSSRSSGADQEWENEASERDEAALKQQAQMQDGEEQRRERSKSNVVTKSETKPTVDSTTTVEVPMETKSPDPMVMNGKLGGKQSKDMDRGDLNNGPVVTEKLAQKPADMPEKPPPPPNVVVDKKKIVLAPPQQQPSTGVDNFDGSEVSGATGNSYKQYRPNPWVATAEDRYSTFAADVDTASYTQARRFINSSVLPPSASVRVEEFVNYFNYSYQPPKEGAFTVHMEGAPSPFTVGRHLVKIGIKGKVLAKSERKQANLVFLVDTSGSMSGEDRLPLAREALKVMVDNLNENDTVALVTYAGSVRDVLPPTPATERAKIFAAFDSLQSGGGTAMGSGLELAYKHAVKKVSSRSISRVVVLTDGDTNIGQNQSADQMLGSIKNHVEEGVTLTMVGFGMGNYRDTLMEKLADAGNGNCFYIDSVKEAKRVFQEKLAGTLEVIAKDVKLQVEFNPQAVAAYRLVGYENRDIADKDFRNDKVDAGEIGAGHTVTALYEVQLTGKANEQIATVRIRAKEPSGQTAKEAAFSFGRDRVRETIDEATADFRFAAAVAGTADILRGNPQTEGWSLATAEKLAKGSAGENPDRQEFVRLVQKARVMIGDVNVAAR